MERARLDEGARFLVVPSSARRASLLHRTFASVAELSRELPCANLEALCTQDPSWSRTFFATTLPAMQSAACEAPARVPILRAGVDARLTLSQTQLLGLLSAGLLGLLGDPEPGMPSTDFGQLLTQPARMQKLRALLHYFGRATQTPRNRVVTFHRRVLTHLPSWPLCEARLSQCAVRVQCEGRIEDTDCAQYLHADFANAIIGGGVLTKGCVQEEIQFLISPECIAARFFCEPLTAAEVLVMRGVERWSRYTGYGDTFQFAGDYVDHCPVVGNQLVRVVVAFDALLFRGRESQTSPRNLARELNKAYAAFFAEADEGRPVRAMATSSWGCGTNARGLGSSCLTCLVCSCAGAFGGDRHVKFLVQWLAASVAQRSLLYLCFDDPQLERELAECVAVLTALDCSVAQVHKWMLDYQPARAGPTLLAFVSQCASAAVPP